MKYLLILLSIFYLSGMAWALEIKSSAFSDGENIPAKYTCSSTDVSPQLEWSDVPKGTKSFVLICDDPDAPSGDWVHWVIYNIPADQTSLEENVSKLSRLADDIFQGKNDFGNAGYGGPCPPPGRPHRYFFKIYALDTVLSLKERIEKKDLLEAMEGHILAEAKIMGLYKR